MGGYRYGMSLDAYEPFSIASVNSPGVVASGKYLPGGVALCQPGTGQSSPLVLQTPFSTYFSAKMEPLNALW